LPLVLEFGASGKRERIIAVAGEGMKECDPEVLQPGFVPSFMDSTLEEKASEAEFPKLILMYFSRLTNI